MMAEQVPLAAFTAIGIELEYAIVAKDSLSPMPVADRLLASASGDLKGEVDRGMLGWSNEFMLHVIEIKNPQPATTLDILPAAFEREIQYINNQLAAYGAQLMPTAMHPWMDARCEARIWPHNNRDLYQCYARIFDCNSHGWANLQSMHINLPFSNDDEFTRLHNAIRMVLPILPAMAASSPIADGRRTGYADFRMETYRTNALSIPSITGQVIPEPVSTRAEYESAILAPMYRDIAPFDPQCLLQKEWLNSRGAIPRFDRNAIEIRVIDTQECPDADLAIAALTVATVKRLYAKQNASESQISTATLAGIFLQCIRAGEQAVIDDARYLERMDYPGRRCTARELWHCLVEQAEKSSEAAQPFWRGPVHHILRHGPLARRILHAVSRDESVPALRTVYQQLCDCLHTGRLYLPA